MIMGLQQFNTLDHFITPLRYAGCHFMCSEISQRLDTFATQMTVLQARLCIGKLFIQLYEKPKKPSLNGVFNTFTVLFSAIYTPTTEITHVICRTWS